MKHVSIGMLGLALALGGVAAAPAPAKDKPAKDAPGKPSDAVTKAAQIIQPALAKSDFATAKAKLDEVAPSIQNDDDKLYVGQWYVQVGQGTKDNDALSKGIELMLSSSKVPAANVAQLAFAQGQLAYQAKDYPKATTAMQRAIAAGNADPSALPILVDSLRQQRQLLPALQALNDGVTKLQTAGQPVPAEWFPRGFAIAYEAKPADPNFAAIRQAGMDLDKKWVAAEPKGTVWHDVVLLYRESVPTADTELKTDMNRLLLASNGLQGGNDYLEYAEEVYQRYPGEAKAVLDAAVGKGVLNLASNRNAQEISQIANGKVAADKASLSASDKSARAAATGKSAMSTADAYLGYGDYAKAIDLYNVALGKSGVDANVINTHIGIAQLRSGDKAGAKTSFAKVTGQRKELADLWMVLIDHPATA